MKTTAIYLLCIILVATIIPYGDARHLSQDSNLGIPWFGGGFPSWSSGVNYLSFVCKEKGKCYKKTLKCPSKCFRSKNSKKHGGAGGGGGGCTFDCKKCKTYC